MELILFAMISLIVIVAVLASRLTDNSFPFPFEGKAAVYTSAEKNFQRLVEQALGNNYRVLNRVKLADIITIRKGVSERAKQSAIKNADNKYLDFVICERDSMKLLGVIDLVDTQGKGYKLKKDWFVSGALEAASIAHLRIKVKATYSVEDIRACINARILKSSGLKPKVQGRIIPAALVKARNKSTGVVTPAAAKAQAGESISLPNKSSITPMHALPH